MRSRSASRRATSAAANISAGRPSSPYTTARRQADTTQARSLPSRPARASDSSASAEPLRGGARPPQRGERGLAGVEQQRVVVEAARHRQRLVDEGAALLERRAVVELVGQAQQHPAAQRAVRRPAAGRGCAAAPRRPPRAPRPAAADCHSAPCVVAMAARAISSTSPRLSPTAIASLDRRGELRPHAPTSGRRRPAASARRSARAGRRSASSSIESSAPREQLGGLLVGVAAPRQRGGVDGRAPGPAGVRRPGGRASAGRPRWRAPAGPRAPRRRGRGPAPGGSRSARPAGCRGPGRGRTRSCSTPSSRTSPAASAGSTTSSRSSASIPVASGQGRGVEPRPITAAVRSAPTVASGSRARRRVSTSCTPAGGCSSASRWARSARSPASRAYSTRKNGLPSVRSRSALAWSGVGRLWATVANTSPTSSGAQAGEAAAECVPAGQRLGDVGERPGRLGVSRQVSSTSSRPVLGGLDEQPQHPQAAGVGPVQVVEDHHEHRLLARPRRGRVRAIRSKARNSSLSTSARVSAAGWLPRASSTVVHGHSGGAPSSCEHRPMQTRAPRRRAAATSSAASRDLPIPGSPVSTAYVGVPARARSQASPSAARSASRPTIGQSAPDAGAGAGVGLGAGWARTACRGCCGGGHPLQRRVLPEHRRLEVAQLGAGLDPELLVEHVAHLAQHLEGVRLTPRPGQGERAQHPEPLAQRVRRGQRLQLGGHRRVLAERQRGDRPVLQRDQAQLLEPGPLGDRLRARPRARRTACRATGPSASSRRRRQRAELVAPTARAARTGRAAAAGGAGRRPPRSNRSASSASGASRSA